MCHSRYCIKPTGKVPPPILLILFVKMSMAGGESSPFRSDLQSGKVRKTLLCRALLPLNFLDLAQVVTGKGAALQVALVTGGSSGIGFEIARQLGVYSSHLISCCMHPCQTRSGMHDFDMSCRSAWCQIDYFRKEAAGVG